MAEVKCPKCGTVISLEQSELDSVIAQVRTEEFEREVNERLRIAEHEKQQAVQLAQEKLRNQLAENAAKDNAQKDARIAELTAQLESQTKSFEAEKQLAVSQAVANAERERDSLRAAIDLKDSEMKLAVTQAVAEIERERDNLRATVDLKETEKAALEARMNEQLVQQAKSKEEVIAYQAQEIERLKDMKARLSTKMMGESLEQHCQNEFNRVRAMAFPNAYFEKDNDASQGTKGDFIFRECDDQGNEIISIMFEMKNEGDTDSRKKRNEDHFAKLDSDRTKKDCEYAVLVSLLEPDNDLYNDGIVDVSWQYPKMYVVRPQFFLPIISLLRAGAMRSLEYKREIALMRSQELDITNFEHDLDLFKEGFFRNFEQASKRYDDAIEGIDKTIALLNKIKDNLTKSEKHLVAANNKLEDLTVKKLTRKNPTMRDKFAALTDGSDSDPDSEAE